MKHSSYRRLTLSQRAGCFCRSKYFAARQPARDQTIGREVGDDLTTILGHDDLLLNARRPRAVLGTLPGLEREYHAFLERRVLASITLGDDWPLPQRQANAMPVLQQKCLSFVAIAEFLRVRPHLRHLIGSNAWSDHVDGGADPF